MRETDGLRVEIGYRDTSAANEFGVDQGASNSQISLPVGELTIGVLCLSVRACICLSI